MVNVGVLLFIFLIDITVAPLARRRRLDVCLRVDELEEFKACLVLNNVLFLSKKKYIYNLKMEPVII